jgi:hypothetical protein
LKFADISTSIRITTGRTANVRRGIDAITARKKAHKDASATVEPAYPSMNMWKNTV